MLVVSGLWEWKDGSSPFLMALYGGWAGIDMVLRLVRYPKKWKKFYLSQNEAVTQFKFIMDWYSSRQKYNKIIDLNIGDNGAGRGPLIIKKLLETKTQFNKDATSWTRTAVGFCTKRKKRGFVFTRFFLTKIFENLIKLEYGDF